MRSVAVMGMAQSGVAVAEFLARRGDHVRAIDSKPIEELQGVGERLAAIGATFCQQSPEALDGVDLVVISPGVPADIPELAAARRRGIPVIGEVELAAEHLKGPSIGITGSNGKTTTTALTGHILRESGVPVQVGGNIGKAVTAMIASSLPDQWNVLELSSFQLETIDKFRVRVGVCVNVTPDHLDRHHTFEGYAGAKGRLFETQQPSDFAVLNADDETCNEYASRTHARVVWFSTKKPADMWADARRVYSGSEPFLEIRDIPLRGRHNVENVCAAAAAARLAGVPLEKIAAAVRSFPGVEHRIEFVRTVRGVAWYNDSKATNVDAALKAVEAFDGPLWIILGGKDKGAPYAPLAPLLQAKGKAALLIGAAAEKIERELAGAVPLERCGTIEAAVRKAAEGAAAGDTVLLAPACASFDQFQSYEHRGRVFKELVRAIQE
ncbi:MAG TPA: UDP-N-acetylmuramoyl-L-alanine--D-glutamate ligase [Bryobacteraceae bacterium]|nr:UDP-N-acetylmuramoyl-L-alanine--D-glutamate ligase [Bryobacteraceae bacterium]